jgi:hypothetical protein
VLREASGGVGHLGVYAEVVIVVAVAALLDCEMSVLVETVM